MGADRIKSQTDANQRKAADPGASVWVSASAGTGKTSVLISRLERLLLQGVRPERILCLTYTNAAAAEMQNRLYAELKDWAAMEGEVLAARLRALTGADADESVMARARQLFTLTLETKGGLKIHTIHGFCERLLHRFPLEAGIAPEFEVLDEAQAAELRQRAADRVLSAAASEPGSDLGVALADIVSRASEITFRDLLKRALRQSPPEADGEGDGAGTGGLASLLGLEAARGEGRAEEMAGVLDDGTLERAAAALDQGGTSDQQKAVAFRAVLAATGQRRVAALRDAFLTKQNEPFTTMATKAVCEAEPGLVGALETARDRFFELWLRDQAFEVLAANRSLDRLMRAIGAAYAAEKAARAALDYDDLIDRTAALLNSAEAAQWVLYKLDYGIDHILVDEAQDTSPLQWRVIGALAGEFFAGEGAREALRTVFAVGDEKQSIYGFQGARPEQFAQAGRAFEKRVKGARHRWERVPLNLSFRSAPAVLDAVDAVFAAPAPARGLTWGGEPVQHHANREGEHGLVEIWGTEVTERGETAAPFAPLDDDRAEPDAPTRLARRIAGQIDTWLREKTVLPSGGQPIEPGDILILVRKRHPFALPMIRALKDRAIPVAGADRMRLTEQLAVMDLMAFGEAMLTPRDDLALACALKSPLVGFDDDDLFALAHGRRGPLWEALEARSGEDERFAAAAAMLRTWRGRADYMAP